MGVPATSENFGDLLSPNLFKVFDDTFNRGESMLPALYNMQKSEKSEEKFSAVGGFPSTPEFTGTINYSGVSQQYDTTITPTEFADGFQIERKLYEDDLYSIMDSKPKGLARGAFTRREEDGASLFVNAFNTSVFTGGDALSLCNSAHTSVTSGVSTQSNTGTSALSQTSVEAARIAMGKFRNWEGKIIDVIPDLILIPIDLEQTGWEIIASKGKVETANNNANFHFGRYKLAVWKYLSSTTDWFMLSTDQMEMSLYWVDRIPLEFNQDVSFNTYIKMWSCYMRYGFGFTDWRWIYANNA